MDEKSEYSRIIEVPEQEQVGLEIYAQNPRRYQNALIENKDGLPESVLELDEISLRQMMNYINKTTCDYTGKTTYLNKVVSFINSGVYTQSYLDSVFGKRYKTMSRKQTRGSHSKQGNHDEVIEEQEIQYYIKNRNEYAKIEIDALQNWEAKGLESVYQEYAVFSSGKLNKEIVEQSILSGLLNSKDETIRLRYIKEAMNFLGLNKGSNALQQVNVYTQGGGAGLGKKITETTGNDNFVLMDVEVEDE